MEGGYFERHINRMRNIYKTRINTIKDCISSLNKNITIHGENTGLHIVLEFPEGTDIKLLIDKAKEKGIFLTDINSYYVKGRHHKPAIVLGYTGINNENIIKAFDLLKEVW